MGIQSKCLRTLRAFLNEEGTTTLEMAFVMVPVLVLLMGTLEFAILFHVQSLMIYAGNEASRMGQTGRYPKLSANLKNNPLCSVSHHCRTVVMQDKIQEILGHWANKEDIKLTVKHYGSFNDAVVRQNGHSGAGEGGDIVYYTVKLDWKMITPVVAQLVGNKITLRTQMLIKNESYTSNQVY